MPLLKAESQFYAFSAGNPPALSVQPGEEVTLEAQDCFGNQIQNEDGLSSVVDWGRVNPGTGPVFVEGADPGDTLVAHVLEIRSATQGVMTAVLGLGALGHMITEAQTRIVPITEGQALSSGEVQMPLSPMVGVIGTAPREGAIPNGTLGPQGGNAHSANEYAVVDQIEPRCQGGHA